MLPGVLLHLQKSAAVAGPGALHGQPAGAEAARTLPQVIGAPLQIRVLHHGERGADGEDRAQFLGRDLVEVAGQTVEVPFVEIDERFVVAIVVREFVERAGHRPLIGREIETIAQLFKRTAHQLQGHAVVVIDDRRLEDRVAGETDCSPCELTVHARRGDEEIDPIATPEAGSH